MRSASRKTEPDIEISSASKPKELDAEMDSASSRSASVTFAEERESHDDLIRIDWKGIKCKIEREYLH